MCFNKNSTLQPMKKLLSRALLLGAMLIALPAQAQFEGQVSMKVYGDDDKGNPQTSEFSLYATKDRIAIKGDEAYSFMDGNYDASGILIRNDKKDFIVMMGENEALHFTKEELEGLFQMFTMMSGDDVETENEMDADFRYTNKTKVILGHECTELLITDKDSGNSLSIWLTAEIDINWGMLAQPWNNVPESMKNSANRVTQEFKSKNFPMQIQVNEDGTSETIFEVTNVLESSIAKAMVEVPAGVSLKSLSEIMFSLMMQNR